MAQSHGMADLGHPVAAVLLAVEADFGLAPGYACMMIDAALLSAACVQAFEELIVAALAAVRL
jgi:hypothetical protein